VADERSCARARDVDRHETELREIRERYYLREVALEKIGALAERLRVVEDELTSIRRGNRVALLGGLGAVVTAVILQFITKGSGH